MKMIAAFCLYMAMLACGASGGGGTGGGGPTPNDKKPVDLSLVPDAQGPAPRIKEMRSAATFDELIAHMAPSFVSEKLDYPELANRWQAVLDFEKLDIGYLHFPYQGSMDSAKKVTASGHACVQTLFVIPRQIPRRDFYQTTTFSTAATILLNQNTPLKKIRHVKVLTESPSYAANSYEYSWVGEQTIGAKKYIDHKGLYTSHVGVVSDRFVEAHEFVLTTYSNEGKDIFTKETSRCVRVIEPKKNYEQSSCSNSMTRGVDRSTDVSADLLEFSKASGKYSVKHWQGRDAENFGVRKLYIEATQTSATGAHFVNDFSREWSTSFSGADGFVNPHYKFAEGDLTFTFGKDDVADKRDVDNCMVDKIEVKI